MEFGYGLISWVMQEYATLSIEVHILSRAFTLERHSVSLFVVRIHLFAKAHHYSWSMVPFLMKDLLFIDLGSSTVMRKSTSRKSKSAEALISPSYQMRNRPAALPFPSDKPSTGGFLSASKFQLSLSAVPTYGIP